MSEIPTSSEVSSYVASSYVKKTLQKGETEPFFFSLSRWQYAGALLYWIPVTIVPVIALGKLLSVLLAIVAFVLLQVCYLLYVYLKRAATEYAVSNKRVVVKVGILSRKTNEVRPQAIEAVTVDQGILGRLLNFGSCVIRGRGVGNLRMGYVIDPLKVKTTIERYTS